MSCLHNVNPSRVLISFSSAGQHQLLWRWPNVSSNLRHMHAYSQSVLMRTNASRQGRGLFGYRTAGPSHRHLEIGAGFIPFLPCAPTASLASFRISVASMLDVNPKSDCISVLAIGSRTKLLRFIIPVEVSVGAQGSLDKSVCCMMLQWTGLNIWST